MATTIKCPKCGNEFDIENVLSVEVEEKYQKEYQQKLNKSLNELEAEKRRLSNEQKEFEEKKRKENELFIQRVNQEKQKIEDVVRKELTKENDTKIKFLEEKLATDESKINKLEEKELEALRLRNEYDELKRNIQREKEKYLLENSSKVINEALSKEQEKFELERKKWEIQMDQQKKLIEEMERKANQGSMQLQGESQELALVDILKFEYPNDVIGEVKKGEEGADVIHGVYNDFRQECGKIFYESKRTKTWQEKWISKLKDDMRNGNAHAAVIVTKVLPRDIEKFGRKDGIWLCTFENVKIVAAILRDGLINVHEKNKMLDNVSDKKEQLYKYMSGNEFKQKWEAIIETYMNMNRQLAKEKTRTIKDWNERQKQLDNMVNNAMGFVGDVKGIGGLDIGDIKLIDEGEDD